MKCYVVTYRNDYEDQFATVEKVFIDKDEAYKYANYEKNECKVSGCFEGYQVTELELETGIYIVQTIVKKRSYDRLVKQYSYALNKLKEYQERFK